MQILKGNNIKSLSDLKEKELRQDHKLQKMYKAGILLTCFNPFIDKI
ncbi:hypothetical protein [Butyrivibrio fibrisolvens]|nr:hypothetical protein [Butyrivibrio fibrisolvens]